MKKCMKPLAKPQLAIKKSIFSVTVLLSFLIMGFTFSATAEEEAAAEDMMAIAADHADYHGDVITLTGHAVVGHELGVLCADKMVLESRSKVKEISFDYLQMDDHVDISLKEAGRLSCARATIDYETYTGVFLSGKSQERVVYREACAVKKGGHAPLVIQSSKMLVNLIKEGLEKARSEKVAIGNITAEGDVRINYDCHFTATADQAVFKRDQAAHGKEVLPGEVTLSCLPGNLCHVISHEGDEIFSNKILINTVHKELTFIDPKGSLKSFSSASHPLDFTAKKLVWDDLNSKLILSEDVEVYQSGFGKLEAANDVRLVLNTVNGKKVPLTMETKGEAVLTYTDLDNGLDHTLRSYGSLKVDHQKMETKLQSPENAEGTVIEGQQVFFKDAKGVIYADKAFVKYDYIDQKIMPVRIVLQGNVKITNNLEQSVKDKTPTEQYILADRVDFIPETKEMIFKASKGRRVLLYDQANNLEVSAPGLKLIRDIATSKETVQGIGDVRFSFIEAELNQLRRHFSFDKVMSGQESAIGKE